MAGGEADGHQQVEAFFALGNDGSVRNWGGAGRTNLNVAFIDATAINDDAPAVVRVHLISGEPSGIGHFEVGSHGSRLQSSLGPKSFSALCGCKLWRPASEIRIFVSRQPPLPRLITYDLGYALIIAKEIE
ncbi:hypothetical protein Back11_57430 [Paenibacillus baekrokdamisoli]|uniref:Uncharacterized protein n=1 Tax=Paenibacillus baekrokdamisoli TaxID=1712516 RepID=A0A3G9JJX1_9BACL|nr:hypothetical protein Back11_57430 [Paenibacillus baekrokdamisoli]